MELEAPFCAPRLIGVNNSVPLRFAPGPMGADRFVTPSVSRYDADAMSLPVPENDVVR